MKAEILKILNAEASSGQQCDSTYINLCDFENVADLIAEKLNEIEPCKNVNCSNPFMINQFENKGE